MLHRFGFADGRVTYANRFLKSNAFCAAETSRKIAYGEFATDPCRRCSGASPRCSTPSSLPTATSIS
jgi:carotenoid cleavage dioxygenase-like enzyme